MIVEPQFRHKSERHPRIGRLFLNGTEVGGVLVRGHDGAWGFGEFTPSPEFSTFAAIFGRWSLLMHADEADARLSEAAADELRAAEYEIDALRAALLFEPAQESRPLSQIIIDGPLIEWKE